MATSNTRKRKHKQELKQRTRALSKPKAENNGDTDGPTLLKFPGEIRNKIWSHTFDYYDYINCGRRIDITCFRKFPKMPSAAAVCRQMMAEVLGVFLNETKFVIWISDCEGKRDVPANTAYMQLCKLQREIGKVKNAPIKLSEAHNAPTRMLSGGPSFDNVVKWAKAVHSSDLDLKYDAAEVNGWFKIIYELFQTAITLRPLPWEDVKRVMLSMRRIAAIDDREWVIGEWGGLYADSDFSVSGCGSKHYVLETVSDLEGYEDYEDFEEDRLVMSGREEARSLWPSVTADTCL